jgi:hypothetical protein
MKHLSLLLALVAACSSAQVDPAGPGTGGALVFSCCGETDSVVMAQMKRHDSTPEAQRPPELALFPYRTSTGITTRERMIVTDQATWAQVWTDIVKNHSPTPGPPTVDFDRETIVVAAMGQRSSGGYVITIDSSGVEGNTVVLTVTERSPGPTCGTTAALTAPVALARILRPRATVRFVEKTAVTDCG